MFKMLLELFSLLTKEQRKKFYLLQALVILMTFTEIISIASIAPFMSLVGNIELLNENEIFIFISEFLEIYDPHIFLLYCGLFVLIMLLLSTFVTMYTTWSLSLYANKVGIEISDRLFTFYMHQNWLYFTKTSTSHLTKQVTTEAIRVTDGIIQPLLSLNAKIILVKCIFIVIFIMDPLIAVAGIVLFTCAYLILYRLVRNVLERNGNNMSVLQTERFKILNEGFGGIKDILLLNRRENLVSLFKMSGKIFYRARGVNSAISQVPRTFMELLAFGTMITLILFLIIRYDGNLGNVLPVLSVYALAAFKLLPAFQQIYSSISQIKGNIAGYEAIRLDLINSKDLQEIVNFNENISKDEFVDFKELKIKNLSYTYPENVKAALTNINFNIKANTTIGIVGSSGSGKSTLADLLLGLINPSSGTIEIDNIKLDKNNIKNWQKNIGFVQQNIFLSEGTIAENIAFGIPKNDINNTDVKKVSKMSHLDEFVEEMPNGLRTLVGERGVKLSGGQKQRIGIARSLYTDPSILVFDEATSALDGVTEKIIMEAIEDFKGKRTIILIAHRLKTLVSCDRIICLDNGKLVDVGTYDDLFKDCDLFRNMAQNS